MAGFSDPLLRIEEFEDPGLEVVEAAMEFNEDSIDLVSRQSELVARAHEMIREVGVPAVLEALVELSAISTDDISDDFGL